MGKTLKDPKDIFQDIIHDFSVLYGDDLVSILLYGSAAGSDYRPGESDINFMIVLTDEGITRLDKAFAPVQKWRKSRVAIPLFLTESYIKTSTDVFPIEYLNFRRNYILVYGKDVLKDLHFEVNHVRLQCEREIKGKLLLLRETFLETAGKAHPMRSAISQSIQAFCAVFGALLFLKGQEPSSHRRDLMKATSESFDLNAALFDRLLDVKEGKVKPRGEALKALYVEYLEEIRKLMKIIDAWEE
jgi:hypothetical protein